MARQQIVRPRVILLYIPNRSKANFQKPNSTTAQPNIANVRFETKNDFCTSTHSWHFQLMKHGKLYKGQVRTVLTHPPPPIILRKLIGTPNNLGVDLFGGHFRF